LQDKEFYGKGCPWNCPHAVGVRSYADLQFPNADRLKDSAFLIGGGGGFLTEEESVIAGILKAFRKISKNADRIRAAFVRGNLKGTF